MNIFNNLKNSNFTNFFPAVDVNAKTEPCRPSPCGPNSQCKDIKNQAVCSCLPTYFGSPPACRPECAVSSDCPFNRACINQKCVDPCPASCARNANCKVVNHSPICFCKAQFTGDPFTFCFFNEGATFFSFATHQHFYYALYSKFINHIPFA